MSPIPSSHRARLLAVAGIATVLACTGCVHNVSWLPDSSGFIHAGKGDRQIVHYDLASRKQRVVVEDTGARTPWPTVSPDGKRVAVARYFVNKDFPNTMEVIIYDLNGKEVKHSTQFPWSGTGDSTNHRLEETYLHWAPRGEHVIVVAGESTGIYDVKNDGLVVLDNAFPFMAGGSPVRPDGDGFLVARQVRENAFGYTFVNWEGREYDLDMGPITGTEDRAWLQFPLLYNSHWEGNVAAVKHSTNRLRLDTNKYKGSFQANAPRENAAFEVHQQVVFENKAVLRVVHDGVPERPHESKGFRLEYLEGPESKPRVILGRAERCMLFPAPNRRLVAIRYDPDNKESVIRVINEKGEIVAETPAGG